MRVIVCTQAASICNVIFEQAGVVLLSGGGACPDAYRIGVKLIFIYDL